MMAEPKDVISRVAALYYPPRGCDSWNARARNTTNSHQIQSNQLVTAKKIRPLPANNIDAERHRISHFPSGTPIHPWIGGNPRNNGKARGDRARQLVR
jgi:hypothetical protein